MPSEREMNAKLFNTLYIDVMKMLRENLPENLYYHTPEHTMDVINSAERIGISEGKGEDATVAAAERDPQPGGVEHQRRLVQERMQRRGRLPPRRRRG